MKRIYKKDLSIFNILMRYGRKKHISFHMPGHKGGEMIPHYLKRNIFRIDVTELGYNDDLNDPKSVIKDLQENIAKEYRCLKSYLLVNGATQGILTAIHACCGKNDKILISADSHISVLNALKLTCSQALFISRPFNSGRGLREPCTLEGVRNAYAQAPDSKVLFFTYPNYYGRCADAKSIIEFAHEKGITVIADEAHGAHFHFSDLYPESAVDLGADIVIQSMHKTLPVVTQVGLLHVNNSSLLDSIGSSIRIFSTTSPSYIFLVSAEFGFRYMQISGKIELKRIVDAIGRIGKFDRIERVKSDDPARIVFDVSKTGYSGYEISRMLSVRYGVYAEMADPEYIVLIASVMNRNSDFKKLSRALMKIDGQAVCANIKKPEIGHSEAGKKSEKNVFIYPPGIPLILKGEAYSKEKAEYMEKVRSLGGEIIEC
jgi:arginine/lysine/ornithine decarboxylase